MSSSDVAYHDAGAATPDRVMSIVLAGTFTLDPIAASVSFWLEILKKPASLTFESYEQTFQALLDPSSLLRANRDGVNVLVVRAADLAPTQGDVDRAERDLVSAVRTAIDACPAPLVVLVTPSFREDAQHAWVAELETRLVAGLGAIAGVSAAGPADITALYPVDAIFDDYTNALARIPYSDGYYVALGTALARRIHAFVLPPKKVIAVDCDGTLWTGICAEAGPAGVVIDEGRRALQQFLVRQREAGTLLCVVSRNVEKDVFAVFDARRDDMPLKREHILEWRVSWSLKSESVSSIAKAIGVGVDSVVLLDDDPYIGAEVRERCPGATVITVPRESVELPAFLLHLWIFDRLTVTDEDRQRATRYADDRKRGRERESMSLREFVETLDLEVTIEPMTQEQVPRVAQLTQRTNQFNATGRRYSEAEVRTLGSTGSECVVVHVCDRFGSYGLVGAVMYRPGADTLTVESFVLSCRVLGRGVEHQIAAALARMARTCGAHTLVVPFTPTERNEPFARFHSALMSQSGVIAPNEVALLDASRVAELRYEPESAPAAAGAPVATTKAKTAAVAGAAVDYAAIASQWRDVRSIEEAMATNDADVNHTHAQGFPEREGHRLLRSEVSAIWCSLLKLDDVRTNEDFFALGGHSLLAIRCLAKIRAQCSVELPLSVMLEGGATIDKLVSAILDAQQSGTRPQPPPPVADKDAPLSDAADDLLKEMSGLAPGELEALLAATRNE